MTMSRVAGAVLVLAQVCRATCVRAMARPMENAQALVILGRTHLRSQFHIDASVYPPTYAHVHAYVYAYVCRLTPRGHRCFAIPLRPCSAARSCLTKVGGRPQLFRSTPRARSLCRAHRAVGAGTPAREAEGHFDCSRRRREVL